MNQAELTGDCDLQRADAFLQSEQYQMDDPQLIRHLDTCSFCRAYMESQAADEKIWATFGEMLKPDEFDRAGAALFSAATLIGGQTGHHPVAIQGVLDALTPSDDPHRLGRLGSYEISGVVGLGGMGVVLKAHDPSLDRVVAVKVMAPTLANDEKARQRFAREAKAAAAILHPNVIPIYSVSSDDKIPFLVMSYIRGGSLQKRLEHDGPLPTLEVLRIGSQIAAGLAAAHKQGLVHRDIKPENILLEEGVERVTITDFGLARAIDDNTVTRVGTIAGTPMYMSPEQARGEHVDWQSDLFSLGCVLYTLCTGRPPFQGESSLGVMRQIIEEEPTSVLEINSDVPNWLWHIIQKLMAKDKAMRYYSASEVQKLLESCLNHAQHPEVVKLPDEVKTILGAQRFSLTPFNSAVSRLREYKWLLVGTVLTGLLLIGFAGSYLKSQLSAHQEAKTNYVQLRAGLLAADRDVAEIRQLQKSEIGRPYLWRLGAEFPEFAVFEGSAGEEFESIGSLLYVHPGSNKTMVESWYLKGGNIHGHVNYGTYSQLKLNSIRYVTRESNQHVLLGFEASIVPRYRDFLNRYNLKPGGHYETEISLAAFIENNFDLTSNPRFLGIPESSHKQLKHMTTLSGSWELSSLELDGKINSKQSLAKSNSLTFSDNTIAVNVPILLHRITGKYSLNTATTPAQINIINDDGSRLSVIYELDGKTLRVCMGPGNIAPKEMQTGNSSGRQILTFTKTPNGEGRFTTELARNLLTNAAAFPAAKLHSLMNSKNSLGPDSIQSQSLTWVLLSLSDPSAAKTEVKKTGVKKDFYLNDAIPVETLLKTVSRPWNAYSTILKPEYITDCQPTFSPLDQDEVEGWVSFKASGVYEGKINFKAAKVNGKWKIIEFRLPNQKILLSLGNDGKWKRENQPDQ